MSEDISVRDGYKNHIEALQTQLEGLKKALAVYADEENWAVEEDCMDVWEPGKNGYEIAKQAIKTLEESDE